MEKIFRKDIVVLREVFAFLGGFMEEHAVSSSVAYVVNLAVEEFFTNMVKYGGGGADGVSISITRQEDHLVVSLLDRDVKPFDVTKVPRPHVDQSLENRKRGGLGIEIARSLVDSLDYEHVDNCSRITFTKRLG